MYTYTALYRHFSSYKADMFYLRMSRKGNYHKIHHMSMCLKCIIIIIFTQKWIKPKEKFTTKPPILGFKYYEEIPHIEKIWPPTQCCDWIQSKVG